MWWWLWLIVALIAVVVEIVGSGLVFVGIAGAALITAIIAVFIPSILVQAIVFAVASTAYLIGLRPPVLRLVSGQHPSLFTTHPVAHDLIGRRAIVTQEVTQDGGQIRIGHGEFWSARAYDQNRTMTPGSRVEIMMVEGLTALVAPVETGTAQAPERLSSGD